MTTNSEKAAAPMQDQVQALRDKFLKEHADSTTSGAYDARDVEFVKTSDAYLSCFIRSFSNDTGDLIKPTESLDTVLKFRNEIKINDLTVESFPQELIERKVVYWNGVDKENRKILLFKVVRHQKGKQLQIVKSYITWILEQHHRNNLGGDRIVLIFDFTDAGVTNMDLEVTRFIITSMSTYFPGILHFILLYEMPWLLSSIWKVIRSWLTEEQKKRVLLVKKVEMPTYVEAAQLEAHMQPS